MYSLTIIHANFLEFKNHLNETEVTFSQLLRTNY